MKKLPIVASVLATLLAVTALPSAASASTELDPDLVPAPVPVGEVVVYGGELDLPAGTETTTTVESFEIDPDTGALVGMNYPTDIPPGTITPMASWGSSYAYAEEYAYVTYRGVGKAAANVYSGQRIITVCFWWARGGSAVTGTTCSNASSATGAWRAGPEVVGWATDSLDSNAPKTIFNIQTTRINPNII